MSTPWIVAAGVLTLLVAVLTATLVVVMCRVSDLESRLSRVQNQVRSLQRGSSPSPSPPQPPAASVMVLLEATREADVALADDMRRAGGVSWDIPTKVYVPDDDSGRDLAAGLAVDVEPFYRESALSESFPSVVVLDASGGVLASGSPDTVQGLESLVARRGHTHARP